MYLSQSQISGWRRKCCLRRRYKGHRIRRFSQGLSRHKLAPTGRSLFHGALTKSPPAIVPESAPVKTARSVCSGESTLCPLDWRRKDFLFHPLTNVCGPEIRQVIQGREPKARCFKKRFGVIFKVGAYCENHENHLRLQL